MLLSGQQMTFFFFLSAKPVTIYSRSSRTSLRCSCLLISVVLLGRSFYVKSMEAFCSHLEVYCVTEGDYYGQQSTEPCRGYFFSLSHLSKFLLKDDILAYSRWQTVVFWLCSRFFHAFHYTQLKELIMAFARSRPCSVSPRVVVFFFFSIKNSTKTTQLFRHFRRHQSQTRL